MVNQPLSAEKHLSKSMMIFVLWAGLFGVAVQFNESVKNLAIWIGLVEFFSLAVTSRKYFDEREQQLLNQSFSLTFQWLAIALLVTFGFLQVSERLSVASNITSFINSHWIGLTVSIMALLLGLIGLRSFREN
jgi:uncharacterized Tic20 family protein